MKGKHLSFPVVKKYSQKISFWKNYIEFDIMMFVQTHASYLTTLMLTIVGT